MDILNLEELGDIDEMERELWVGKEGWFAEDLIVGRGFLLEVVAS